MAMTYGDFSYIEGKWEQWKEENNGWNDAESALNFIEAECAQDYSFEEQDEIFDYIGCLEEKE